MSSATRTNRLGWIVVLIAVVFVGQSALDAWQRQQFAEDRRQALYCLIEYNTEASRVAKLHQDRTAEDRRAIRKVIQALETSDQAKINSALNDYMVGAKQRNRAAEANPPPDPDDYPCLEE